jgi:hypothetical protein
MGRLAVVLVGAFFLASCAFAGSDDAERGSGPAAADPRQSVQAVAAALGFVAHSDPDVAVVDGYAILPVAVQRGEQPIAEGNANPCAQPPAEPFTAAERASIRAAFQGRSVHFVGDPVAALSSRGPGALLLAAARPLLGEQRGTVMIISCVPGPQQMLVNVHWDGHGWQAMATGAG